MAFDATTILQLVLVLTGNCLSTTPANQQHPLFTQIFTSYVIFEQIASTTSLVFAPGLFSTLQAATPPTVAFFKSLPTNVNKRWAVYLIFLEKSGSRAKIYIGSGTESLRGISNRFYNYDQAEHLPLYPEGSERRLYHQTQRTPMLDSNPICCLTTYNSSLVSCVEATFSYVFRAMRTTKRDYGMSQICPGPSIPLSIMACAPTALCEKVSLTTLILLLRNSKHSCQS
jgi:hypothetical protein